jgi:hypothetical protein
MKLSAEKMAGMIETRMSAASKLRPDLHPPVSNDTCVQHRCRGGSKLVSGMRRCAYIGSDRVSVEPKNLKIL